MGEALVIRDAVAADLEAIFAIYNAEVLAGTATWDVEPRPPGEHVEWLVEHRAPYCALVAVEAGEVVAWGSLSPVSRRLGFRFTVEDTVYVRPDRQRRGIGRAVLLELLARAQARGFHAVVGKISGDNAGSIALHLACGFMEVGRERELGHKFGRWLDLVTVQAVFE